MSARGPVWRQGGDVSERSGTRVDDPFGGRQPTSHERMTGQSWDASYDDGPAPWDIGRPQPAVVRLAAAGKFARRCRGDSGRYGQVPEASDGRWDWLVADGRDVAGRDLGPGQQEGMQVGDVIGLDDEIGRVVREGQPITEDLDVLRLTVEEGFRASLSVWAIVGCVRLRDMEEHGQDLCFPGAGLRVGDLSAWKTPREALAATCLSMPALCPRAAR